MIKRKVWPLPCSHSLSQPWLCSRCNLPYQLFVERSNSLLRFPR
nr:MAG TPA: zinc finger domain-containing protein [Caudoviricetes sp.]DAZ77137.1 MAG TPA: zinc finger domain-containing protein [Caudoviricetes sp.]